MDPIRNHDGSPGDSTAAVRPRTDVPSPEPTLSSANSASPTGTSFHDAPITPLNATSFITDETKSTHSRGDSWASFSHELLYEFPISLGMAATIQEPREEPTTTARARKNSIPLPKSGATLDMAFFLKNASPNADGKAVVLKDKVNLKRMGLGIFKKKREEDASNQKAVYNSPPHDRAEPKVTQQGTPYLQIVPHPTPFKIEGLNISKSPGLLWPNSPHHLSVPSHEDNPDAYGTETIDNWISTFSTSNQEDGLDSPTSKGISILYNTPSDSSKRNSYMIPAGTLPWSAEDSGFKLTVDNALQQETQREEESKIPLALGSNPPSSPNQHKRSISIPIPGYDRQITCTFDDDSLEQLIEAACESPKDKMDRRAAGLMSRQWSGKSIVEAEQTSASNSSVKDSKALPCLPSEANESANNNNPTASSMLQMWRQRDAATTGSVKATYVPRSRRTTMIKSFQDLGHQDDEHEEDSQTGAHKDSTPPSTARSSQIQGSAASTSTTNRNSMALSQVMLVAEQMPVPRGRHVNKPAPLLLRSRPGGKTKTIAVREGDLETDYVSVQMTIPTPHSVSAPDSGVSKSSTGDTPVLLRPIKFTEPQRVAPRAPSPSPAPVRPRSRSRSRAPSPQPSRVANLGQTPPGVPPRSLARLNSTTEAARPVLEQQQQQQHQQQQQQQPEQQESSASQSSASSHGPILHFPKRSSSLISKSRHDYVYTFAQPQTKGQGKEESPTQPSTSTTPAPSTKKLQPPPPPRQPSSRPSNQTTANQTSTTAPPPSKRKHQLITDLETLHREKESWKRERESLKRERESLRRENKLLEAALMAVLKTGGTLNKCPCGFFESRGASRERSRRRDGSGRDKDGERRMRDGRVRDREGRGKGKRVQEGGKGSIDLGRVREVRDDGDVREGEGDNGYLSVTAVDGGSRTCSISTSHSGGGGMSGGVGGSGGGGGLRVGRRARTGSVASFESGGSGVSARSGVSALDVYMGTRV